MEGQIRIMARGVSLSCRMQTHLIIVIKILRLLTPLKLAAMTSFAVNESAAEARLEKSGNVFLLHNSVLLKNKGSNRQGHGSKCTAFQVMYLAMNQDMTKMQPNKATHCSHQCTAKPGGKRNGGSHSDFSRRDVNFHTCLTLVGIIKKPGMIRYAISNKLITEGIYNYLNKPSGSKGARHQSGAFGGSGP